MDGDIDDAVKFTHYSNENKAITNGSAVLPALSNLGSGNDYTINAVNGAITMEFNMVTGDKILINYDSQDA